MTVARARELVQKAVGKLATKVQAEMGKDQRVTVHIDAPLTAEKDLLSHLMQVPEIASSNLRLDIHLGE
jgi:hypothetical protein